jgi:hypothetical protein
MSSNLNYAGPSEEDVGIQTEERGSIKLVLARLFQPALAAAYALDPLYGIVKSEQFDYLPDLSDKHETMARAVILRVGGAQAVAEFNDFMLTGWKGNAAQLAANCANSLSDDV